MLSATLRPYKHSTIVTNGHKNQRFAKSKEVQRHPQADAFAAHLILPNAPKPKHHPTSDRDNFQLDRQWNINSYLLTKS